MDALQKDDIMSVVRKRYGMLARQDQKGCCDADLSDCCGPKTAVSKLVEDPGVFAYSLPDRARIPEEALMGLGCGNPGAIAAVKPGETVLDLGSGGGIDCFLAAHNAGETGRVIGVDMTPEMVQKARKTAAQYGYSTIDFRLGEIENLPVADQTVDVIISNCVINLSPDKNRVFAETFRVLKPGGRLAVADMVASQPIPAQYREDMNLYTGCVSGAVYIEDLKEMLVLAGFKDVALHMKPENQKAACAKGTGLQDYVTSAMIRAVRPAG